MRQDPYDSPRVGGLVVWLVIAVVAGMGLLALLDPGAVDVLVTAELQGIRRPAEGTRQPIGLPPGPGICLGGWPAKHVAAVACSATGPPELIGRIPGPRAEAQFRRALSISQGDWTVFFTDTLALALLLIAALALLGPFLWRLLGGRRQIRAA